jgi:hypothetical protein
MQQFVLVGRGARGRAEPTKRMYNVLRVCVCVLVGREGIGDGLGAVWAAAR